MIYSLSNFRVMKNLVFFFIFNCFISSAYAQNAPTKTKQIDQTSSSEEVKEKTTQLNASNLNTREHECSKACKDGKHIYAHGEKGHKCGAVCMKKMSLESKSYLKDHVCSTSCKAGQHVYAHGEKGHSCTSACHKTKSVETVKPEKKS